MAANLLGDESLEHAGPSEVKQKAYAKVEELKSSLKDGNMGPHQVRAARVCLRRVCGCVAACVASRQRLLRRRLSTPSIAAKSRPADRLPPSNPQFDQEFTKVWSLTREAEEEEPSKAGWNVSSYVTEGHRGR